MRKSLTVTITDEGRDKDKQFILTEMPALQAHYWAVKAILALGKNGVDLPEGFEESGMAGIAKLGIELVFKLPYDIARELLDDLLTCVKCIPDPQKPNITRNLIADDIEEVKTYFNLEIEVFKLHVDF